ncbi:MAG: hypothetical protein U0354_15825 [Candidatus Sericytochromatia bacterium]
MSENINFDFMPIFLRSGRDTEKKERAFVNTDVQETDILKQPEFFENVYKSIHMKKDSEDNMTQKDSSALLKANPNAEQIKNKISKPEENFSISDISVKALNSNKDIINDMFKTLKS